MAVKLNDVSRLNQVGKILARVRSLLCCGSILILRVARVNGRDLLDVLLESDGLEAGALHVRANLVWHFNEDLLSKVTALDALVELDKLHDVASYSLSLLIAKWSIVAIKLFHSRKVSIAHTNNDDGARILSKLVDQIFSPCHVVDCSISEQEKDLI